MSNKRNADSAWNAAKRRVMKEFPPTPRENEALDSVDALVMRANFPPVLDETDTVRRIERIFQVLSAKEDNNGIV